MIIACKIYADFCDICFVPSSGPLPPQPKEEGEGSERGRGKEKGAREGKGGRRGEGGKERGVRGEGRAGGRE